MSNIQLHKNDLPDDLKLGNILAIDGEFMGLNVRRDPLCLIQISSGNSDAHIVQFDRKAYNCPNLTKLLVDEKITKGYQQEFRNISLQLSSNLSFHEWFQVYKKIIYWELELSKSNDSSIDEIISMQKSEANSQFFRFVSRNYQDWINNIESPLLSHNLLETKVFPLLNSSSPVYLLLIDNLRYDQWKVLEDKLSYPLSAYAAVIFDAQSFGSLPVRGYHVRGRLIQVPTNYFPRQEGNRSLADYDRNVTTGADSGGTYQQWDGNFRGDKETFTSPTHVNHEPVYSDNPAWVFYDLVTNDRYGIGKYINSSEIDKYELFRIAKYCDAVSYTHLTLPTILLV